ncbi:MAG: YciI family protein [Acidimicrobiales bacterium]
MRYLLLLYSAADAGPADGSPEQAAQMPKWFEFSNELSEAGSHLAGEALHGEETATTVRVRDGAPIVTDGPFAETKEVLGGFYMIDVENLDEAKKWAAKVPLAPYGSVEIRPIMEIDVPS